MNVDLKITGRVSSLHLEPGDRVLVTLDSHIGAAQVSELSKQVKKAFPDHQVVVLANGLRLTKETK